MADSSTFELEPPNGGAGRGSRPTPRNQFSFSRLKTLHQCPLRYRLRYLKGSPEAFRSIETYLGSCVHTVLEWLYREREQTTEPQVAPMLERFADTWTSSWTDDVTVVRLDHSADHFYRLGREMLERFHRDTFSADRSTTVALERRLNKKLSPSVVFTGFADRIGRTRSGRLFVVDYKTSRQQGNASDFSEGLQAPLYAACALDHHDDEEALAGYHYLRHGSTRWQSITREQADGVLQRFSALANDALAASEFPARPGPLCPWCGYNKVCPSARVPEPLSGGLRHS